MTMGDFTMNISDDDLYILWIRIKAAGDTDIPKFLETMVVKDKRIAELTLQVVKNDLPQYLDYYEKLLLLA